MVLLGDARLAERTLVRAVWSRKQRCEDPSGLRPAGLTFLISLIRQRSRSASASRTRIHVAGIRLCRRRFCQRVLLKRLGVTMDARLTAAKEGPGARLCPTIA